MLIKSFFEKLGYVPIESYNLINAEANEYVEQICRKNRELSNLLIEKDNYKLMTEQLFKQVEDLTTQLEALKPTPVEAKEDVSPKVSKLARARKTVKTGRNVKKSKE